MLTAHSVGANDAFEEALKLDPANAQAKSGLAAVKRAIEAEAQADGLDSDPSGGLGNMFNDPKMIEKIAKNPKTAQFLSDPAFMAKLQNFKNNPGAMAGEMQSDPRIMQVMGVLLGIDLSMAGPGGFDKPKESKEGEEDVEMPDARSTSTKPAQKEPEPEPEDEEALAAKKAKEEADEEKKLGTENYKKRQFDAAIEHYSKAWELHKDITYLTNLSAAYFEKGDYQAAIDTCTKAIEEGREVRTDFKIIAKQVSQSLSFVMMS